MKTLWLSCRIFTILVEIDRDTVVGAAPIARKFIGQPYQNLLTWAKKYPPVKESELKP